MTKRLKPETDAISRGLSSRTRFICRITKNIYRLYNKLAAVGPRNPAERHAKFNATLNDVSGGNAKEFLTTRGCAPF